MGMNANLANLANMLCSPLISVKKICPKRNKSAPLGPLGERFSFEGSSMSEGAWRPGKSTRSHQRRAPCQKLRNIYQAYWFNFTVWFCKKAFTVYLLAKVQKLHHAKEVIQTVWKTLLYIHRQNLQTVRFLLLVFREGCDLWLLHSLDIFTYGLTVRLRNDYTLYPKYYR